MGDGEPALADRDVPSIDETAYVIENIKELYATELRAEAAEWERDNGIPRSVFERLGATGMYAARWPHGARAPGRVEIAEVAIREMTLASVGATVASGTHLEAYFRALARCEYGEEAWDDALAGRRVGAFSVTETSGGSNPTNCSTVARRTDTGWVLNGHKHYCSNLRAATDIVMFTRTADKKEFSSFTVFIVPTDHPGITLTPHTVAGNRAAATGMVELEDVDIGDERRVGSVGTGLILLLDLLRAERVLAAVAGLTVAELTFEMALAFAEKRWVSGEERLRDKQAIAHRLATLSAEISATRALVRERLQGLQTGRLSSAEAGEAKLVANRVGFKAADEAVQILGGRGLTEETPLAQIWRDIRIGRIGGGTDEVQLELISSAMKRTELSTHPAVLAAERAAEA